MVVTSYYPIISNSLLLLTLSACATGGERHRPRMAEGTISYPFIADTKPVGRAQAKLPFIIRTAVGASEFTVEIPDDANRYDIQIPLASLSPTGSTDSKLRTRADGKPINPGTTDKELVGALPSLSKMKPNETAMMDAAFGVGSPEGPVQSPSYTLGMAKVNDHFRDRNFELALVELNNLIAFYPNSPKLLKMKGTLLIKTGNRDLAMSSWQRASDLAPQDAALQRSITLLSSRITMEQTAQSGRFRREAAAVTNPPSFSPIASVAPIAQTPITTVPVQLRAKENAAGSQPQGKPAPQQAATASKQGSPATQQSKPATQQQILDTLAH